MIETRNATELVDYLVSLELVDPALRDKIIKTPYGPLASRKEIDNGYKSMQLFIQQDGPNTPYKVEGFTARVVGFPAYEHVISQHMSTAELEERMAAIDWNKESFKILKYPGDPVDTLFNDVLFLRLAGNHVAQDIMDILLLKYCDITPAINMVPYPVHDKPFVKELFVPLHRHISDISLLQAWNLLEDRAVMKFQVEGDRNSAVWFRYVDKALVEYANFNLPGIVSALPIIGNPGFEKRAPLFLQLINGDQVPIRIKQPKGKAVRANLLVDPAGACIVGTDETGRSLRFDQQDSALEEKRRQHASQNKKQEKKGKKKGRSL